MRGWTGFISTITSPIGSGVRAGRTKIPFGLYNEVNDIDSARVPILLPQAVYPIINRNFLLAQTGAELYGYLGLGLAGGLEYRIYGGTLFADAPALPARHGAQQIQGPLSGRRPRSCGRRRSTDCASVAASRRCASTSTPRSRHADRAGDSRRGSSVRALAGVGRIHRATTCCWPANSATGTPTSTSPACRRTGITNQRFYGMASYRVTPWFAPGVYYSSLLTDIHKPLTRDNYQHDFAATLRFDINPYWLVKLEGHYIDGTTDLSAALNNGATSRLTERRCWRGSGFSF